MRRYLSLLAIIGLFLTLGTGAIAHAAEGFGCDAAPASLSIDHADGDGDQVPADDGSAVAHHHGGCHGHHVGTAVPRMAIGLPLVARAPLHMAHGVGLPAIVDDPALRPPIA